MLVYRCISTTRSKIIYILWWQQVFGTSVQRCIADDVTAYADEHAHKNGQMEQRVKPVPPRTAETAHVKAGRGRHGRHETYCADPRIVGAMDAQVDKSPEHQGTPDVVHVPAPGRPGVAPKVDGDGGGQGRRGGQEGAADAPGKRGGDEPEGAGRAQEMGVLEGLQGVFTFRPSEE